MRVALTGTPGTGKTTASERLPYRVLHLNDVVREHDLWTERDEGRDSLVVDVEALADWVDDHVDAAASVEDDAEDASAVDAADSAAANAADAATDDDVVVLESHLAHLLDADRVVVLRCRPDVLEERLRKRGAAESTGHETAGSTANTGPADSSQALARKARENAESEALDVVLSEAVDRHGEECVYEIDTTDVDVDAVAAAIEAVVAGERDPAVGTVDFTGYLQP